MLAALQSKVDASPLRCAVRCLYVRNAASQCAAKTHERPPAGALRTFTCCRFALPLPALSLRVPTFTGFAGGRTRPYQWRAGPIAGLLATVAPYPLAARLAWLLLGVTISPMGVWRVAQRLAKRRASHGCPEPVSCRQPQYRRTDAGRPVDRSVGCGWLQLGMQVRSNRRHRKAGETLPPLPPVEEGHFREVKTGVLLLPASAWKPPPVGAR